MGAHLTVRFKRLLNNDSGKKSTLWLIVPVKKNVSSTKQGHIAYLASAH
jgi:hypothetical protein